MKIALYPGSFDPVTLGHLDVIKRASKLFDKLYVAVMVNVDKTTLFTAEERVEMLGAVISDFQNVEVVSRHGLTATLAAELGATTLVKGIRGNIDFDVEYQMALINRALNHELDTVFLPADSLLAHVSSTAARSIASVGGDLKGFVPEKILPVIMKKLSERSKNN